MTRCQVVQPCWVMVTLVAEGEIDGRPAAAEGLAGRQRLTGEAGADQTDDRAVARRSGWPAASPSSGSPWESNAFRLILQSGLALL